MSVALSLKRIVRKTSTCTCTPAHVKQVWPQHDSLCICTCSFLNNSNFHFNASSVEMPPKYFRDNSLAKELCVWAIFKRLAFLVTLKSFMTQYIDQNFLEEAGDSFWSVAAAHYRCQCEWRTTGSSGAETLNWFPAARLLLSFGVSWSDGWGRSCGRAGINPHLSEGGQNNDCRYQPLTQIPAALAAQCVKAAVIWSGWWGECLPSSTSLPASRWRLHLLSHLPTH